MANDISSNNQSISSIKALANVDDSYTILADRLSSFNFNGDIGKKISQESVADVLAGDIIFLSDPFYSDENQHFVTKKNQVVQADGSIRNYIYVLTKENIEEPFTYKSTFEDGSYDNAASFYTISDDINNVQLGTDGWLLTRNGNAIFSNVFVRGTIEATSGKFDGVLTAGVDSKDQPLVSIGADIFNGTAFETRTEEHNGIFLDDNNYLLSFAGSSEVAISKVDIINNTQTDHTTFIELIIGTHSFAVGDFVSLDGFDEEIYPTVNGTKVVSSVTATTISFKIDKDFTGLTNPVTEDFLIRSDRVEGIFQGTQFNYNQVNSATENISTVKIYTSSNILTALDPGDFIDLINFTNPDLLSLNASLSVQSIEATYFTVFVPRITAAANITSGLGVISEKTKQSKFKVGNEINNLIFTSETGNLSVTGTINAKAGNFTDTVTIGKDSTTFGTLQVGTNATSVIKIVGTNSAATSKIHSGVGTFKNANTGFYMDASGQFSISDQLYFEGGVLTAPGITTTSLTVGTSPNRMIMSPTAIPGGAGSPGLYMEKTQDFINATTGGFRLGSSTGISYSGTGNVAIGTGATFAGALSAASGTFNGDISAASGTFTGSLSGSTITGGTIKTSATTGNGSTAGVIIDSTSARFFNNSSATAVTTISTTTGAITATSADISGVIKATSGEFTGNVQIKTGGNLFLGTSISSGSRIVLGSTNITAYNTSGLEAFYLPTNGDRPRLTDFNVLNAKVTGDGPNAYIIAGGIDETSTSIVIRGYNTGTLPAAIYNVKAGVKTLFDSGTGFYMDDDGFFKVGTTTSNAKFDPTANSGTGQFSVTGEINATSGYIGGTTSGWKITEGIIESSGSINKIILNSGTTTGLSSISIGALGDPSFYADSDGSLQIGSGLRSLTYDPVSGVTVQGTVKATSGFIGQDATTGWTFGSDGRLQSGQGDDTVVLVSSSANFSGGSSTTRVTRILVDDESQEAGGVTGTIYLTVDLANVHPFYRSLDSEEVLTTGTFTLGGNTVTVLDATGIVIGMFVTGTGIAPNSTVTNVSGTTITVSNNHIANGTGVSLTFVAIGFYDKAISFSFADISSGIGQLLNEKRLNVYNVTNTLPFRAQIPNFDEEGNPITPYVGALDDFRPTFIERSGTTLTFYTEEKLAGFTGYNSSFDLAVGQTVTLFTDSIVSAISSLNGTTATISAIDTTTTYYDPDYDTNYYKITMTTVSTATLARTEDFDEAYAYKALTATQRTLSVYPEDLGINVLNFQGYTSYSSVSTSATGTTGSAQITVSSNSGILDRMSAIAVGATPYASGTGINPYSKVVGTPATTTVNLSRSNTSAVSSTTVFASASVTFYDNFAPGGLGTYYMWAGDADPIASSFSIVQNRSTKKVLIRADAGTVPVGSITMWATQTVPLGWTICNGNAITYADYPELYVALGGVSPYTATVLLPDLRGRFALGASTATPAMPVGRLSKAIGSAATNAFTHNHTTSLAHNHADNFSVNTHNHSDNFSVSTHNHSDNIATGGANSQTVASGTDYAWFVSGAQYRYHTHGINGSVSTNNATNQGGKMSGSVSTNNATNQGGNIGGSVTAQAATTTATAAQTEILPPYVPLHYIIYTGVI